MIMLAEARKKIGRTVIYRAHPDATPEEGVITRVGEYYIHVRYIGEHGSKATAPADLDWP
jgi:hypothetical protein